MEIRRTTVLALAILLTWQLPDSADPPHLGAKAAATDKVHCYNQGPVFFFGGSLSVFETAALSPDGKWLVETGLTNAGTVRDPLTGQARFQVALGDRGFGSDSMRFAPDSSTLVLRDTDGKDSWRDGKVHFFDVPTATLLRSSPVLEQFWPTAFAFSPDGHTVAVGGYDGSIALLEFATAGMCLHFRGHLGQVNELSFSPDGKRLASASDDGTILVWQLDQLPGLKIDAAPLTKKEKRALWVDLASASTGVAYQAILRLSRDARNAPDFLPRQLRQLWTHDARQLRQFVVDLGSDKYVVRTKASTELKKLGDVAAPALQEALQNKPSLEAHLRIKALLAILKGPTPSSWQLRVLRAIEALEHGPTAAGKQWLAELASNAPGTLLGREARLALVRLKQGKAN